MVRTEHHYVLPPEKYLQEYPDPQLRGDTNRDLIEWGRDGQETSRLHESDKQALREWRTKMEEVAK